MARPDKEAAVADITARFNDSDAALLTEYRGLRVSEIAEVRSALRDADSDYKVLKNTLTRIAVREVGLDELVDMLIGPTAIAFIKGDAAAAAKALDEAAKKYPVLTIKGGVLNGKIIGAEQARELAKLEPREVLLAKIAMMMNQPAQQTVNVFAALLRDLGSMLAQVLAQKEEETPATEPAAAGPVAEPPAAEAAGEEAPEPPASEVATAEAPEAEVSAEPAEAEEAEVAEEAVQPETEQEDEAEAAAEEAEPPAETAEAVDQAPAAPESDAAEAQPVSDESEVKEEE